MKRIFLGLVLMFLAHSLAGGETLQPPVPTDPGASLDILPPPLDLDQLTPVTLPSAPGAAPSAAGLTPQAAAVLKSLDDAQPTPTKVPEKPQAAAPTSTPLALAATPTPEAAEKPAVSPAASLGAFADYFPTAKGTKWSYEYLKPAPGEEAKKTRIVESLVQEPAAGGGLNALFKITEGDKSSQEKYFLSADKIARLTKDDQALTDDFVFQFPAKGAVVRWMSGGNYFKASFGSAQVYQKTYPDCVIVTEKTKSATVIFYYAKVIGLVAVEVYGKGMKLDQTKSIALVQGPA